MKPSLPLFLVAVCLVLLSAPTLMAEQPRATFDEPPPTDFRPDEARASAPNSPEDTYNGRVRVYLVEPASRWVDRFDDFYENALLDFPIVDNISLADGAVWYATAEWDQSAINLGYMSDQNIMAIAAVSQSSSTVKDADDQGGGYYFSAHLLDACAEAVPGQIGHHGTAPNYTHKVLAEECTAEFCVYCPDAREALSTMHASGNYHFTHVALVRDANPIADSYVRSAYVTPTPTVFFDGGSEVIMGGGTNMLPYYEPSVEACGMREVAPLELITAIEWTGDYGAGVYSVRVHVAVANNTSANTAPSAPGVPTLLTVAEPGQSAHLYTAATDPETNLLYYRWDYGDGTISDWEGPLTSGAESMVEHVWADNGDFDVRVKAKDPFGEESAWSDPLSVHVNCCQGKVGDANQSGEDEPSIGDISVIIDALFITQDWSNIECLQEADINRSAGSSNPTTEDITIGDVSLLIDYLFITGPSLGLGDCI